ncbi:DUF6879 family protein [Streptomyces sp. NPDC058274]|uniref:DUF6879 family protein n=1 Tax=Streptomyces sp. NPDC058274 TaxID=3346416 RepID=UPI0036EDBEA5
MELISPAQRNQLFDSYERDAFHLELRDNYAVPGEASPFASWQQGEPEDLTWHEPWLGLVRRATSNGRTIRRVRVVTEPLSPYIQWEYSVTPQNQGAGEDIRWLPRHLLPKGIVFPADGNDWWLFDDRLLAVGHFDDQCRVLGSELIEAPAVLADCISVRDTLWDIAIPHTEYKP